jgi:hypothetical protein
MRSRLGVAAFCAAAAFIVIGTRPSEALYAAQAYRYCGRTSGATNCYYSAITECRRSSEPGMCESNPWYIGDRALARGLSNHIDRDAHPN